REGSFSHRGKGALFYFGLPSRKRRVVMGTKQSPRRRSKAASGAKGKASNGHNTGSPGRTQAAALTAAASTYRDNHHWVPLRLQGKNPECRGRGWQPPPLQDPFPKFKDGENKGILLGGPSGGIGPLDPDLPTIPEGPDPLFPETTAVFERASAPRYGRLF